MDYLITTIDGTAALISANLPKLFFFCVFLVCGWLFALLLRKLTKRLLNKLQLEVWAEKFGVEEFLLKGGVRYTSTTLITNGVYCLVLVFVALSGLKYIGVPIGEEFLEKVGLFIPRLIGAFVVLIFGIGLSRFVFSALLAYLNNLAVSGARTFAKSVQITIIILITLLSLEMLDIGGNLLVYTFLMAFGALCLAFGIAFGLAGQGFAKDLLDKILNR